MSDPLSIHISRMFDFAFFLGLTRNLQSPVIWKFGTVMEIWKPFFKERASISNNCSSFHLTVPHLNDRRSHIFRNLSKTTAKSKILKTFWVLKMYLDIEAIINGKCPFFVVLSCSYSWICISICKSTISLFVDRWVHIAWWCLPVAQSSGRSSSRSTTPTPPIQSSTSREWGRL